MHKRLVGGLLAISVLAAPFSGWAAPVKTFSDVSTALPEYRPITKLASQGAIKGREDGTFGPADPVKHLEALVMVLRFFGYEKTADAAGSQLTAADEARFGGKVPAWGRGYLVVAGSQNYIEPGEQFNWQQGASRAWIARTLVKMLGHDQNAQAKMNQPLTFTDDHQIPPALRGYIAAAVELGLIRGYEDGSFQPNRTVSRGEMAIFLDRAERQMKQLPPGEAQATVITAQDGVITAIGSEGLMLNLALDPNARIFIKDKLGTAADLQPQDQIRYINNGDQVVYVEASQGMTTTSSTLRGEVIQNNSTTGMITIRKADGSLGSYFLATGVKIINMLGQPMTSTGITAGTVVQLSLNHESKASQILVEASSQNSSQGTIVDINLASKLLIIADTPNHLSTYMLSDTTAVEYKGQRFASVSDLRNGDKIAVETDGANSVTKITVITAQDTNQIEGTVSLIDRDKRIVTIKAGSSLYAYEVPSTTSVQFSDGTKAGFDQIYAGDSVTVAVNNGAVTKLTVNKTGTTTGIVGKIVSVDTDRRLLIVKDPQGQLRSYDIKDPVILDIEGISSPRLTHLAIDSMIEFQLIDEKVSYIKVRNTTECVVTRVDSDSHLITLRDLTGVEKNYLVSDDVEVQIYKRSGEDLGDVNVNDRVKVRITGDIVEQIKVQTFLSGQITDRSESSNNVYIKDTNDDERSYQIGSDIDLVVPNQPDARVADLTRGQWAVVTYWGNTPEVVTIQEPVSGEVTAVDAGYGKITVRQYDGTLRVCAVAPTLKVEKNGETTGALSTITTGDRVQLILDNQARVFRASATRKVTGTVTGINRGTKEILINDTYLGYLVDSNTYVLQKGVRKTFDDIQHKQNVTIYYLPGYKALEVLLPN
ncbi:S-layer homology domain-containing protein [Heliophilum fasciatum]|uniref:S-layer family protein n=1 Tax=Heliophilum fasciatum TaxID=35700 RepID=A0A4R2S1N6_9FIRM|nr:S-layer homology domain-containing protein [Heliophilum fasciatum]MCW2277464.1 hypothetical protein [Heliophilum fasciatum]TCP65245.1 S-layer family protein [Heliophilum fasciatum]